MPAIIITATVIPDPDVPMLAVRDPAVRLTEYLSALPHHLHAAREIAADVVLAENSGADLRPFAEAAERQGFPHHFELLPCESSAGHLGRGYGELRMIADAFRGSSAIKRLGEDELVWKVTGRYRVLNLGRLASSAPKVDLYCNLRTVSLDPRQRNLRWVDQWAFAMTPRGFDRYVRPVIGALERGETTSSETLLAQTIFDHRDDARVAPRFAVEPRVSGVAAWDGRSYDRFRTRLFHTGAAAMRRIAPSIWI